MKPLHTPKGRRLPEARTLVMHAALVEIFSFAVNPRMYDDDSFDPDFTANDLLVQYDLAPEEDGAFLCHFGVETRDDRRHHIPAAFSVHLSGVFSVDQDLPADERDRLVHTVAPILLYQSAREYVSFALSKSSAGSVTLPPLEFGSLSHPDRTAGDRSGKGEADAGGLQLLDRKGKSHGPGKGGR